MLRTKRSCPGTSTKPQPQSFPSRPRQIHMCRAEVDGDAAALLLLEPVRIDPGQSFEPRSLTVNDVSGSADNDRFHLLSISPDRQFGKPLVITEQGPAANAGRGCAISRSLVLPKCRFSISFQGNVASAPSLRPTSTPFSPGERVFSMQISRYKSSAPSIEIIIYSGSPGFEGFMIFSTVPAV